MDDRGAVEAQIGRQPRSMVDVGGRCHLGLPIVTIVPPLLHDGTPFPTLYWLTCPLAVRRIGRIEASGGVRRAEEMLAAEPDIAAAYRAAMERYATTRDAMLPTGYEGHRPTGGVGGTSIGVKCLHAHYADTAAGNDNPIGAWTAGQIEPLDCRAPCVVEIDGGTVRNPEWSEPR